MGVASVGELRDDGGDSQPPGRVGADPHSSGCRAEHHPGQTQTRLSQEPTTGRTGGIQVPAHDAALRSKSRGRMTPKGQRYSLTRSGFPARGGLKIGQSLTVVRLVRDRRPLSSESLDRLLVDGQADPRVLGGQDHAVPDRKDLLGLQNLEPG